MSVARGRARQVVGRATLALAVLLAWSPSALALNPALDVSQYAHTAWKVSDGFAKGNVTCVAQTLDGYLWLGTEFGLLRFDGVTAVDWKPPSGQVLPSGYVRSLLVARDGTLWIGTLAGLASWKDGRLTQIQELAGQTINALVEDRERTVWIGAGRTRADGKVCTARAGSVRCQAVDEESGAVLSLYEDRRGTLWMSTLTSFWRWHPGLPVRYRASGVHTLENVTEDDDGALLIGTDTGIRRLAAGADHDAPYPLPNVTRPVGTSRLLRDRDGGLWIGTPEQGLLHVHHGMTDVFTQSDGLSGDFVNRLFEDREGNVWVTTSNGLDRFRELAVPTISVKQGLSSTVWSVRAGNDDSVWAGTRVGLSRLKNGRVTPYANLRAPVVLSLLDGGSGQVRASTMSGISYLEGDRFIPVGGVPGGQARSIVEDPAGNVWVANDERGLLRVSPQDAVQQIPWAQLGRKAPASYLAADAVHGGLWMGFFEGGVAHFADGRIRAAYAAPDGLGGGRVHGLRVDQAGTLWVYTAGGLSRLKDGRVDTLTSANGLPCDTVHWSMNDDAGSVWLYMACGLVRVAQSDLEAWSTDPKRMIRVMVLDASDGVRLHSMPSSNYSPSVAKSPDGRLWFVSGDGISVVDPRRLPFNALPPPVSIERVTADRTTYTTSAADGPVRLPPLVRDLEIDYTALSLVAPEKNRFRVKLEGWDRDWQDVGNRRQVFYNSLPPRSYRFRVSASNNSGVWNEAGATLDFSIAAAYYQTIGFRTLSVFAVLSLFWMVYRYRLRQVAYDFDARLQERVNERTRIARDLHDTLLQSFHGLLFRFQAANNMLPDRPAEAKQKFDAAIDYAAQAITEGRDAVHNLRSAGTADANDLAVAISTLSEELVVIDTDHAKPIVNVAVEGTPRELHPVLRDDLYRIASEALRNAFRHAGARHVEVEIRYEDKQLRLRVRDDGRGIDPAVLWERKPGHFGLPGMRERADLIGGHLDVWSQAGVGTEVELKVPGYAAYAAAAPRQRRWPFAGRTGGPS